MNGVSNPVYAAIRKYGAPELRVLCAGDQTYITELEIKAIAIFQTRDSRFGYNVGLGGDLSPTLVPEVARKGGDSRQGQKRSPEALAKLRTGFAKAATARKGTKASPETRAKMSLTRKGRALSPEHRAKISAGRKGIKFSAETRAKMSAAAKGREAPEALIKLNTARKGKNLSLDHRANLSLAAKRQALGQCPHCGLKANLGNLRRWHFDKCRLH